jgi:hypothetical protein
VSQSVQPGIPGSVVVEMGSERWEVSPDEVLTFGRSKSCTICLTLDDQGVSRRAGSLECEAGTWWLTNRSEKRTLHLVVETGLRLPLAPTQRHAVGYGRLEIVVEGLVRRYSLTVIGHQDSPPANRDDAVVTGLPTHAGQVVYTPDDRLALTAMFAGYLRRFPRHDPHPATYAEAAARLGWSQPRLRKRIEHLRSRLTMAGVANLVGDNALEHLAEHVLATGVITRSDLDLLPPR